MIRAGQETVKDGSNRLVIAIAKGGEPFDGITTFHVSDSEEDRA